MEVMESRPSDDVAWKMGRIMLRYRPIAPKPSVAGAAPGAASEPSQTKKRAGARRKTLSVGGKRGRKSRKADPFLAPVVTLPLMPMTPERKERSIAGDPSPFFCPALTIAGAVASLKAVSVSVTVESVTEAWGATFCGSRNRDAELRRWLEVGDCPAFVSKAADQVTWTNAAYRRMVVLGGGGVGAESPSSSSSSYSSTSWTDAAVLTPEALGEEEVRAELLTRGLVPGDGCRAFTCMTSVRYACGRRGKVSLAAPCDVWRMEDGSLAWRLDVKAALGLSTGNL